MSVCMLRRTCIRPSHRIRRYQLVIVFVAPPSACCVGSVRWFPVYKEVCYGGKPRKIPPEATAYGIDVGFDTPTLQTKTSPLLVTSFFVYFTV